MGYQVMTVRQPGSRNEQVIIWDPATGQVVYSDSYRVRPTSINGVSSTIWNNLSPQERQALQSGGTVTYGGVQVGGNPNLVYGLSSDEWDNLSQDQQAAIALAHGDSWHGQQPLPPPAPPETAQAPTGAALLGQQALEVLLGDRAPELATDVPQGQHAQGDEYRVQLENVASNAGIDTQNMTTLQIREALIQRTLNIASDAGIDTQGMTLDQVHEAIAQHNEQLQQDAINRALGAGWDLSLGNPTYDQARDFLEGRNQYVENRNEQLQQDAINRALSSGWDLSLGRPTYEQARDFLEGQNQYIADQNRDRAISLGWDPDARGGRPEETPEQFLHGLYVDWFRSHTGQSPTGDHDRDQQLLNLATTRSEAGLLEDQENQAGLLPLFRCTDGRTAHRKPRP